MTIFDWFITAGLIGLVFFGWGAFTSETYEQRHRRSTDASEKLSFTGLVLAVVVTFVSVIAVLIMWNDENRCSNTADGMGREHRWGSWTGCLIEADNGEFVPRYMLRFNENGEAVAVE